MKGVRVSAGNRRRIRHPDERNPVFRSVRSTEGQHGVHSQNLITRFVGMNGYGPDPFGAPLVVIGEEAEGNPFRFSTKCRDGETALYYKAFNP